MNRRHFLAALAALPIVGRLFDRAPQVPDFCEGLKPYKLKAADPPPTMTADLVPILETVEVPGLGPIQLLRGELLITTNRMVYRDPDTGRYLIDGRELPPGTRVEPI